MSQLQFTIIQHNTIWNSPEANCSSIEKKIAANAMPKQVIVLPEMFSTGFMMNDDEQTETMDGYTMQWMKRVAGEYKIIIAGSIKVKDNGNQFNRFVWMQPNGVFYTYDKRHLFSMAKENEFFASGISKTIVQANAIKINLQVCYDLRFPVFSRQDKAHPYDVLIYTANWPAKRAYAWKQLLIARAIENQCFVIGVNRVGADANDWQFDGGSCIINPLGEVIMMAGKEEEILSATVEKEAILEIRKSLPFLQDGDDFRIVPTKNIE
jgi:omega-amidase